MRRYATGCEQGFIYIRGEYPLAPRGFRPPSTPARARGFLGRSVMGKGFAFDLEIRRGAGAYICGEETALFNSLEGKRGEPRSKPPFPAQVGLFGKPTVVNNVETLVNVLDIVLRGRRRVGRRSARRRRPARDCSACPGTSQQPGTVRSAVRDHARRAPRPWPAASRDGRSLQAILLGGAAGTFVGPDALSMRLTFEDVRVAGATLGSGVVMVFDDTADLGGHAAAHRPVHGRRIVRPVRSV